MAQGLLFVFAPEIKEHYALVSAFTKQYAASVRGAYPIPIIDDFIASVEDAKIF